MTLEELYQIIEDRKKNMPENSYVVSLFKKGKNLIIQKIGEESTELIIAAKGKSRQRIISETADLLFHLLIFLSSVNISLDEICQELKTRNKSKEKTRQFPKEKGYLSEGPRSGPERSEPTVNALTCTERTCGELCRTSRSME